MLQLIMGTALSAVFLLFQVQASPYKEMSDDFLASASSFGLVIAFICATAFKYSAFTDLNDIQDRSKNAALIPPLLFPLSQSTFAFLVHPSRHSVD